jgi:hypothetical protein
MRTQEAGGEQMQAQVAVDRVGRRGVEVDRRADRLDAHAAHLVDALVGVHVDRRGLAVEGQRGNQASRTRPEARSMVARPWPDARREVLVIGRRG